MAKCAFCDADFETGPGDVLLVCPYCGTAQTFEGAKFTKHHMVRVLFSASDAQRNLLDWISKQLGVPQDLSTSAHFTRQELTFYPFWVSSVDADSTYSGLGKDATFHDPWPQYPGAYKFIKFFYKPESGRFTRRYEISIPAISGMDEKLKKFPIPTRAKEFFSHAHAEEHNGKVLHSKMDEKTAVEQARKEAYDRQTQLIMSEIQKVESRNDNINVRESFLIHVPVWELEYRYGSRKYSALVAASNGYVIKAKYPRSKSFRAAALCSGTLFTLAGAALLTLALVFERLIGAGIVSGSMCFVLGLMMLYKGVSRKEAAEQI
ncbi:MAG: hypothetical protein QXS20_07090 [Candidatus Thorarchaeota archaeon]